MTVLLYLRLLQELLLMMQGRALTHQTALAPSLCMQTWLLLPA